jgi:mono/diheme cytochrome c family protein
MARAPTPSDTPSVAEQPVKATTSKAAGPACNINGFCWFRALVVLGTIALFAIAAALNARAADAGRGQRLAQMHCAACHETAPPARKVVADAPPFEVIGRKYGFDPTVIAATIAGPHRKMNFTPSADDAADIAAYIATLKP